MVIFFNINEARDQLLKDKIVYTLRPRLRKSVGSDIALFGNYYTHLIIGRVFVEFVKKISFEGDLSFYVHQSGFKSVRDWVAAAKGSEFLYKVVLA